MEEDSSRPPAPGALALVQDFVNTRNLESALEGLDSPEALRAWLAGRDLPGGDEPLSEADLRRAWEAREALRALLEANSGAAVDAVAVDTLNHIAAGAPLRMRFDGDGCGQLTPLASGVDAALGRILATVGTAMTDGTWTRLKACRNETCRWAFYDHSKNRSGAWCTMAECGCRVKSRAYRQRRRDKGSTT